jgi:Secretion system C-terminal sorting domain
MNTKLTINIDVMQKIIILMLLASSVIQLNAQNSFIITPGAEVTVIGNTVITLSNMSFVNNGTFNTGSGSLLMTGNSPATISGNNNLSFFDLAVNNSGGVQLGRNIAVGNQLNIGGIMNVKNFSIDMGSNASIINESETNRITDDNGNSGSAVTVRNFVSPLTNVKPANMGVEFVSAPALGKTTITRYATAFALNGSSVGLIKRYYNIEPTNNTALNASARFYYLDAELNGVIENTTVLWKSTNNGVSWTQIAPDSRNTTTNWVQKDNINDFSLWTIGQSNSALPIILSSFNTNCKEDGANLQWATVFEQNSEKFIIEKSKDALNWQAIATIDAKGRAADYAFHDAEGGKVYYRLKQVDKDGSFIYSKVLVSDCAVKSITLLLYPNPAVDYTELVFTSDEAFNTNIRIISGKGQLVKNIQAAVQKGFNKIRINTASFGSGTYTIELNSNKLKLSKPFLKL